MVIPPTVVEWGEGEGEVIYTIDCAFYMSACFGLVCITVTSYSLTVQSFPTSLQCGTGWDAAIRKLDFCSVHFLDLSSRMCARNGPKWDGRLDRGRVLTVGIMFVLKTG